MNIYLIVLITIVVTLVVLTASRHFYYWITEKTALINSICAVRANLNRIDNTLDAHGDTSRRIQAIEDLKISSRLMSVEKDARNFDRDMDKFHNIINRDNERFTLKYNEVIDRFKKGLAHAFVRIGKLEDAKIPSNMDDLLKRFERIVTVQTELKYQDVERKIAILSDKLSNTFIPHDIMNELGDSKQTLGVHANSLHTIRTRLDKLEAE